MRKKLSTFLVLLFLFISIFSCKSETAKIENSQDEEIFYEIYALLIEECFFDLRLLPPFPPAPKLDNNGKLIEADSVEIKRINKNWEEQKKKVLEDTTDVVILVQDSLKVVIESLSNSLYTTKKLELEKIKSTNSKLKFKYYSEFPKGKKLWQRKYKFYLDGILTVGSLYLNSEKSEGHISIGYVKGRLNGSGSTIHFKKSGDGKWKITQVINDWIS